MKRKHAFLSLLSFVAPAFCLLSCQPTLSSLSLEESFEGIEAEVAKFEDFSLYYDPERAGYLVGDYKGSLTALTVPGQATGEDGVTAPVVGLADYAFYGRKGITTVLLGENITSIGEYAFADTDITDLRIEGGITQLGAHAFDQCHLTYYEKEGLQFLPSWEDPYGIAVLDGTFVSYSQEKLFTHALIKPGTTEIVEKALYEHKELETIAIPATVTSIGKKAFAWCESLSSIILPSSITEIGDDAFYNCYALTSAALPSQLTVIPSSLFCYCRPLSSITIPSSVTAIGSSAFYACSALKTVAIPSSVTAIGYDAFQGCSSITDTYISVDSIQGFLSVRGKQYLRGAVHLMDKDGQEITSVTIPDSVTSIGENAFYNCSSIESFHIPASVTSIAQTAFYGCKPKPIAYISVNTIPDFLSMKGMDRLKGTVHLIDKDGQEITSIEIPNSVTSIPVYAFYNCSSLTSIEIPNSITSIGGSAFSGCSSLTSVVIPASVRTVGYHLFYNCSSDLIIYCEAESEPKGWELWSDDFTVVWGYKG